MSNSNQAVLDQMARNAAGDGNGQELYYNPRTGRFEVLSPEEGAKNPDVVVAPYNEQGFFAA